MKVEMKKVLKVLREGTVNPDAPKRFRWKLFYVAPLYQALENSGRSRLL